jgi:AsmA family
MSIWRSPVFYFGILLVSILIGALAAPYVVPWNNYRDDLEHYGQKLTGRDVSIDGDIAVKLFPWPQLEARKVAIGNPVGFSDDAFMKAEVVRVSLSLAGLFSGTLNVESVDVEEPQVNLQRNASGDVNWIFAPQEQVTGQGLLSRVKLDQINVSNGLTSFDDLRNGHSSVFAGLNATLSAQSVLGPWRMQGNAKWNNLPFGLVVTTTEKTAEEPLKFTVKLSPSDVNYPLASVEGAWDGRQFKGAVRLDPQEVTGEKTSAEGAFKPLAMQAQVEVSTERMSLLKLRIAPSDRRDSGTLIEGDAVVEFGTQALAKLELKSPRINMDTLVGAAAMQQWRDGGFLKVANQLMALLPAKLVADYSLNVSVLTSGGQALNDVRLSGGLQREAIRVTQFSAELPGRTTGIFDGIVFPGETSAQLGGKFKFESLDTRAFLGWLAPDWRTTFEKHWTGSRGRLDVQSGAIDWSKDHFGLTDVLYSFEGSPGRASLSAKSGDKPDLNVSVDAGQLDVDSLAPDGWSIIRDGGLPSLMTAVAQDFDAEAINRRFILRSASVLLNGVTAQEVALDVASRASGFEIKLLDIGSVGGARLKGGGSFLDLGNGPEGVLNFRLDAQDPRGFLRLVGLENEGAHWTDALGVTAVDAKVTAAPQKDGPELSVEVRGSSGALNAELVMKARQLEKGRDATLAASGGLSSADSAALAKLVGIVPVGIVGAGDVTFEFNGSLEQGFVVSASMKALNGVAKFEGTADVKQPYLGLSGKFLANAEDGQGVLKAIGLPLGVLVAQPLDLSAVVAAKEGGLEFLDLNGHIAGRRVNGQFGVTSDHRLQGDIETDELDIREVLQLAFMPWDGAVVDLAQGFADTEGPALSGEIFFRPIQFETMTGDAVKEVVVGIGFEEGKRQLSVLSAGENGMKLDIAMTARGTANDLKGTMRWPVSLERLIKTTSGTVLAKGEATFEGEFNATGSSPAAALAAMQGKGNFWLADAALSRMTLEGYAQAVLAAKTQDALTQALSKLDSPPGTVVGKRIGSFNVANGAAEFSPISPIVDGVSASISPQLDLTSGQMKIATTVSLTAQADLPPVTITYSGTAGQMEVRNGTSAMAAKLGYDLLSKEMAELERLQREQQALAEKEDAQRKQDEQRFADYQATRAELREQTRLRKFQASERERRALALQEIVNAAIKNGPALAKAELQRHARQLEIRRNLVHSQPLVPALDSVPRL